MNFHSFNISIRSTVKGLLLLILTAILFILAGIINFSLSYITSHTLFYSLLLVIALNLSSITKLIFFFRNHNSIKGWSSYIFFEIIIIVLTIYLYKYAEENNMISIQGFIFLYTSSDCKANPGHSRSHRQRYLLHQKNGSPPGISVRIPFRFHKPVTGCRSIKNRPCVCWRDARGH